MNIVLRITLTTVLLAQFFFMGTSRTTPALADEPAGQPPSSQVQVRTTGLDGSLQAILNNSEKLTITGNKDFRFKSRLAKGAAYTVKILEMPPGQNCVPNTMSGIVPSGSPVLVEVKCRPKGKWHSSELLAELESPGNRITLANPVAAINQSGEAIVAWQQLEENTWKIFLREKIQGNWSATRMISLPAGSAENPAIALAENGDAVVTWEQKSDAGNVIMMLERRNHEWQNSLSDPVKLSVASGYAWEADVAMTDSGDTLIVWSQESDTGRHAIYKSDYRGGEWDHPRDLADHISPSGGGDALRPQGAINTKGEAIIVWEQPGANGKSQIFKSEFRKGSWHHPAGPGDFINPASTGGRAGAYMPQVAMNGSGDAIIAWQQVHEAKQRIYLSEYRQGEWHHPGSINEAVTGEKIINSRLHDLDMDDAGNGLLLWSSFAERRDALYKSELRNSQWHHPPETAPLVSADTEFKFNISGQAELTWGRGVIAWREQRSNMHSAAFFIEFDGQTWESRPRKLSQENQRVIDISLSSGSGNLILVWQQHDGSMETLYSREYRLN